MVTIIICLIWGPADYSAIKAPVKRPCDRLTANEQSVRPPLSPPTSLYWKDCAAVVRDELILKCKAANVCGISSTNASWLQRSSVFKHLNISVASNQQLVCTQSCLCVCQLKWLLSFKSLLCFSFVSSAELLFSLRPVDIFDSMFGVIFKVSSSKRWTSKVWEHQRQQWIYWSVGVGGVCVQLWVSQFYFTYWWQSAVNFELGSTELFHLLCHCQQAEPRLGFISWMWPC